VNALAESLASALLSDAGMEHEPPVHIERLAQKLGVANIVEADIVEDGRLEGHVGHHTIYVRRRNVTPQRRRFTIAHELAHLALGAHDAKGVARRQFNTDEERLCDEIAAAILIPAAWLNSRFRARTHNLSALRRLAHDTDTSLAAGLVRCKEVMGWPESLVRWTHDGNKWRYRGGAGIPPASHAHVTSAPATADVLDRLGRRFGDQDASVPLRVRGRDLDVHGQFSVGRNYAVGIVRFPRVNRTGGPVVA
jgi:IrrE N-terminal-like domain